VRGIETAALVALLASLLIATVAAAAVGSLVRRQVRHFRRHPVRTTLALLAIFKARPRPPAPAWPVNLTADAMYRDCPLSAWTGDLDRCRWCDQSLPAGSISPICGPRCRHEAEANHYFAKAKVFVLQRDGYICAACGTDRDPQVNHAIPCLGRHEQSGCWHHVDGLNVLCGPGGHGCHQLETNRQRAAGYFP
jgi:5-methylcytosine-specific restriction endonuclease McrA